MSYVSLDHLASLATSIGREALLVKSDIKKAYRMVPIHPNDQHLLEIQWEDSIYIDRMLPFCLCSAPKISAIADTFHWILIQQGIKHICTALPGWFILVASSLDQALSDKATLIATFHQLGVSITNHVCMLYVYHCTCLLAMLFNMMIISTLITTTGYSMQHT